MHVCEIHIFVHAEEATYVTGMIEYRDNTIVLQFHCNVKNLQNLKMELQSLQSLTRTLITTTRNLDSRVRKKEMHEENEPGW